MSAGGWVPGRALTIAGADSGGALEILPGVAAVLTDTAGRLLLHRRRVGNGWAPVSGHVQAGETVTAALDREVAEETGLSVENPRLVAVYSDPAIQTVDYPNGRRVQFVTCVFAGRVSAGQLLGNDEGTAWEWFMPDELPADLLSYAAVWLADARTGRSEVILR